MKLYELTDQFLAVAELVDDPDMPDEALRDTLEGIQGLIEDKAEALLQVVAGMEGDTGAIDAEIKRLQERKRIIQNRADSLREYLRTNMMATGIDKISCPLFSITLAKARPMVVVTDEASIPDEFVVTKVIRSPDKKAILAALKDGQAVAGCELGETKRGLLIR